MASTEHNEVDTSERAIPTRQAAEWLGVSPHVIRSLIASGELAAVDVRSRPDAPPRYVIRIVDLEHFAQSRQVGKGVRDE